jgi:hypothetical protein
MSTKATSMAPERIHPARSRMEKWSSFSTQIGLGATISKLQARWSRPWRKLQLHRLEQHGCRKPRAQRIIARETGYCWTFGEVVFTVGNLSDLIIFFGEGCKSLANINDAKLDGDFSRVCQKRFTSTLNCPSHKTYSCLPRYLSTWGSSALRQ